MIDYQALYKSGELLERIRLAYEHLKACDLCPHDCGVNRLKGELGRCSSSLLPKIASANLHHGEEPPISGSNGSGTIFLSGCSLKCSFCQNFPISQMGVGNQLSTKVLSEKMLDLQQRGAHNINFVTPTHFMPQILAALWLAIPKGFSLPVVWNSSGYEKPELLKLLEGIVSIYLPDMKYSTESAAVKFSSASKYMQTNRLAVLEMFRQVGHLKLDENGVAKRGIIIRHLVLPNRKSGSIRTVKWIADKLGSETNIALMSQYFPAHKAFDTKGLERRLSSAEYDKVVEVLEKLGLENGWIQPIDDEAMLTKDKK